MIFVLLVIIAAVIIMLVVDYQRKKLLNTVLHELNIDSNVIKVYAYDDRVVVKSHQSLDNYTDIKYFRDSNSIENVNYILNNKKEIKDRLVSFLSNNQYQKNIHYKYIAKQLQSFIQRADYYKVYVVYITSAGNNRGERIINISKERLNELIEHPEYLMKKGEYNRYLKKINKDQLDSKKHAYYDKVNEIIDYANNAKDSLIIKSQVKSLDDLTLKLINNTVNSIQKVKSIEGDEWNLLDRIIISIDEQIKTIVQDNEQICEYYKSEDFAKIKETCSLLTQSQKEFNEYITEKANSISELFGKRIVRSETQNEDVYNYIRTYKKSITPFTAEVSAAVFGSAENNPIAYIIKYFYPDKTIYNEQIKKLKILIEELETLKEAKLIIDNYKKEYNRYIKDVPDFVLNNDEDGFYSRLGLAIIDESVLNVEYRFTYTSDGGMAQRSFSVPMNEENITELINQLQNKLSLGALAKEQRALMTTKLRTQIKERDNYTCCECGNSIYKEPNLLLEIDHIIPVSKGGLTQESNLQTLCWKCNRNKGAKIV